MKEDYTVKVLVSVDQQELNKVADVVSDEITKSTGTGLIKGAKDAWASIKTQLGNFVQNSINSIIFDIKSLISSSINELSEMLDLSKLSRSQTRDLAFGYGFSSSQAYGYQKAMSMLGFQSEEDLFYANAQELKQFRQAFDKYSQYYNELYDSGFFETLQEYQVEMSDLKQELQMEIVQFFVDNKEDIKSALKSIMTIAEWVVKGVSWFLGSSETATTADVVSQYNTTSSSSTANLNVNNTFNNVDRSTSSVIADEMRTEYRQIIKALGGV